MSEDTSTATVDPSVTAPLDSGTVADRAQAAAPPPAPDQQQGVVQHGPADTPPPEAPSPRKSLMGDILHAVGELLGGPSTTKRVNPQTGVIESVPLSRSQRIANTAGIYLRGAAAGAAQHGPGATGKAALAGVQEQQQFQQQQTENQQAESKNVQSQLAGQASRAMQSQQMAESAWRMTREKTDVDTATADKLNSMHQLVATDPRNKDWGHYASFADFVSKHQELSQAGTNLAQLQAQGRLMAIPTTEGGKVTGVQVFQVEPDALKERTTEPTIIRRPAGLDDKGQVQYKDFTVPAGVEKGQLLQFQMSGAQDELNATEKAVDQQRQDKLAKSEIGLHYAEAAKMRAETGVQGSEKMITEGINPYTKEQLNINNSPDSLLVDASGNPVPFKMLSAMKPAQSEINRAQFAKSTMHILDSIDELKAQGKLPNGPIQGLTKEVLAKAGLGDKDAQEAIDLISLAQTSATGAHVAGRFSVPVMQKMQGLLKMNMNDEQFAGAESALRNVMQQYVDAGGKMTVGEWKQEHALFAQSPGKPRMVTYDNGKTWQPVQQ